MRGISTTLVSVRSAYNSLNRAGLLRTFHSTAQPRDITEKDRQIQLTRARRSGIRAMEAYHRYKTWKLPQLYARIEQLENELEGIRVGRGARDAKRVVAQSDGEAAQSKAVDTEGTQSKPSPDTETPLSRPTPPPTPPRKPKRRPFDFSKMPVRKIALRFAYDGADYAGLASQGDGVPSSQASAAAFSSAPATLPTVEIVLWNALCATHLVDPSQGFRGAGWARSGRTDSGVSAAGQVVSFWIRSSKVDERGLRKAEEARLAKTYTEGELPYVVSDGEEEQEGEGSKSVVDATAHDPWSSSPLQEGISRDEEEIDYVAAINRLLPPTIRVLAWSPVRPSFDARHNTRYRHYKYFFHTGPPSSMHAPLTHPSHRTTQPRLDISAMQEAASYLLGEHDFRNFCKVDGSKQITNFRRRIDGVSIDKVESGWSEGKGRDVKHLTGLPHDDEEVMYVFNLRGTAFLYHQVRDIMAVLFLVGAGLEKPQIVKELLNVHEEAWEGDMRWLSEAGVRGLGQVKLPRGTATDLDGATAAEPDVIVEHTEEVVQARHDDDQTTRHETQTSASPLSTYTSKPEYVMASDRPLVLWECGYRPKDIAWRSGRYDGPVTPTTRSTLSATADRALITGSSKTNQEMYETWAQHSISAEIWRHFCLAAGSANTGGVVGSGTLYEDARWPAVSTPEQQQHDDTQSGEEYPRSMVTYGNGIARPIVSWKGLKNGKFELPAEVKNERWLEVKKRKEAMRAGKKAEKVEAKTDENGTESAAVTASVAAVVDV